jgi:type IV secretion system protein VirB4
MLAGVSVEQSASDPATQARIDAMIAEGGQANFAARFLVDAGLDWAADLLGGFEGDTTSNEQ